MIKFAMSVAEERSPKFSSRVQKALAIYKEKLESQAE